jgi:type IV pilus assembly protein PilC
MKSALIYPSVILTATILALGFIIIYVVPQFVGMFASNGAELPAITKFIIAASDFLGENWWKLIIGFIVLVIVYKWLFKNVQSFRKTMQTFYMHLPTVGNIIIYNEVATITRTFSSLLKHNVFITDSMEILSKLSNNEVYKEIINRTLINLSKGGKISESFKGEWAFPVVAYEMLVTGESTGQLALMMEKVADHFQQLHSNTVTAIKSLIEPVVIIVLAVGVGFIIMAIIVPMFDLYGQI